MQLDELKKLADTFMEQNKEVNVHFYMRQAVIDYMAEFAQQLLLQQCNVSLSLPLVDSSANAGWRFDYKFLLDLKEKASKEEDVSLEQIDAILFNLISGNAS
jgi:hypothetical protein